METFSALLAICAGNSPVNGEFTTQRPVTRSFDIFFHLRLNKQLSKQSWGWWFEKLSRPLCHCNVNKHAHASRLVLFCWCKVPHNFTAIDQIFFSDLVIYVHVFVNFHAMLTLWVRLVFGSVLNKNTLRILHYTRPNTAFIKKEFTQIVKQPLNNNPLTTNHYLNRRGIISLTPWRLISRPSLSELAKTVRWLLGDPSHKWECSQRMSRTRGVL